MLIPRLKNLAADHDDEDPSLEGICNRSEVWFDRRRYPYGKFSTIS